MKVSIADSDEALDVEGYYSDLKKMGIFGDEAFDVIVRKHGLEFDDPDYGEIAAILMIVKKMSKDGSLTERVLNIYRNLWSMPLDGDELEPYRTALQHEADKIELLISKFQPKVYKKRFIDHWEQPIGSIFAKIHKNTKLVMVCRIRQYSEEYGGKSPLLEFLDWKSKRFPTEAEVEKLARSPLIDRSEAPVTDKKEEALTYVKERGSLPEVATWQDYELEYTSGTLFVVRTSSTQASQIAWYKTVAPSFRSTYPHKFGCYKSCIWKDLDGYAADLFRRYRTLNGYSPWLLENDVAEY